MPIHSFGRRAAVMAALIAATSYAGTAHAQALGPQRQFIALEPLYSHISLDAGGTGGRVGLNGYGARLWINLAPFSGPSHNLIGQTALALFSAYTPPQGTSGVSTVHYGAELDVYPLDVPLGYALDPFISLGAGAFRTKITSTAGGRTVGKNTKFSFTPGLGMRIPLANRLQVRGDVRDAIIFSSPTGAPGQTHTSNNLEFMASLGITF